MSTQIHPKNVHENSPKKKGFIKFVHKNLQICARKFAFYFHEKSAIQKMPELCICIPKGQVKKIGGFFITNPQCFSTLKEKTQPYVGGKGQLFTVDYVPMVPLLSGKPTFKSAISLFYPRLRLASFVPMGLHSPASLPKAYKWKENCP